MDTKRITVPAAEEIIGSYFPALDYGFVALIDYMGSDESIERAARCSYNIGSEERSETERRNLIRYLVRNRHSSPTEMVEATFHIGLPIFVMRQLVRHRTACLSGDTSLHFDMPIGINNNRAKIYKLTVADIYKKFQPIVNQIPSQQKNPYFRKESVQNMYLRCVNEDTLEVSHNHIVDIWESGLKPVYKVTLSDGSNAKMSKDHLCLTEHGWLTIGKIVNLPTSGIFYNTGTCKLISIGLGRENGVTGVANVINEATEDWVPIREWEDWYEVSNQGRVRRIVGGRGSRSFGRCKQLTISNGYTCVSLNRPGVQLLKFVHVLMLESFCSERPKGYLVRHIDGNILNNTLNNLEWSTNSVNAQDRVRDGATTKLSSNSLHIHSVEFIGEEMTYDIEVDGPWHNFSAGGIVVHNSLNEYSGRYSPMPMMFYRPSADQVCYQATDNKQGRSGPVDKYVLDIFNTNRKVISDIVSRDYYDALDMGVAKETARIDLPLSTYTFIYWKIDLRNLFHFIGLRSDPHAQWEIRVYSDILAGIAQRLCPMAFDAFQDYQMNAVTFTQNELRGIRALSHFHVSPLAWENPPDSVKTEINEVLGEYGLSSREKVEFWGKLRLQVKRDFSLNLETAKPSQYFMKIVEDHSLDHKVK